MSKQTCKIYNYHEVLVTYLFVMRNLGIADNVLNKCYTQTRLWSQRTMLHSFQSSIWELQTMCYINDTSLKLARTGLFTGYCTEK